MSKNVPIIALYTHKGGVSKTTNCMHLSWALSKYFDKNILIVDADPQCNITQLLIPESRRETDFFKNTKFTDIYEAMSPIMHGLSKEVQEVMPLQVRREAFSKGGLFLLPGNLKLSTFEPVIALSHSLSTSSSYPIFDSLPGAFSEAVNKAASKCGADLVFVDMGPSIGELNKNIFYALDYFLIPTTADVYCKSTISTMEETLREWARSQKIVADATKNHGIKVKKTLPAFLGTVVSMFNVTGKEGKPVKQQQVWIELIKSSVENNLAPVLMDINMLHDVQVEGYCVAEIPNFLSLLALSQRCSFPIFDIPRDQYLSFDDSKGEWKSMSKTEIESNMKRAEIFKEIFKRFAKNLLQQINK